MENRKLIKDRFDRENPYILLKKDKLGGEWNLYGRKYSARAIATLCRQNEIHKNYEIAFEPPELKNEIEEIVKESVKKKSCLEQKVSKSQN